MLTPEQIQEVKAIVREADRAFDRRNYEGFCRKIWEGTAQAIRFIAKERGWPHETDADVDDAGRRLAGEYADAHSALSSFGTAQFCRTNGQGLVLARYEIEEDRDIVYRFMERLLEESVRDDPSPRRRGIMLWGKQAEQVKAGVKEADVAFELQNYRAFYEKMWEATAQAIKFVATERGWPHQTDQDIETAGLRLARDYEDDFDAMAELGFALFARANGQRLVLKEHEIAYDWEISVRFVDRLIGAPSRYQP